MCEFVQNKSRGNGGATSADACSIDDPLLLLYPLVFSQAEKRSFELHTGRKTLGKQQQQAPDIRDFFVQIISLTWDSPLLVGETLFLRASLTCQLVCCWRGENKEKDGGIIYTHTSLERC